MKKSIKKYEFLWNEDAHSRQDFTFSLPAKIESNKIIYYLIFFIFSAHFIIPSIIHFINLDISQPKDDTKDSHERSIAR